ncbi:MAG: hypothetical protein V4719_10955 [Planctomycetota bacterium]
MKTARYEWLCRCVYIFCAPACILCLLLRGNKWVAIAFGVAASLSHFELGRGAAARKGRNTASPADEVSIHLDQTSTFDRVLGAIAGSVDGLVLAVIAYLLWGGFGIPGFGFEPLATVLCISGAILGMIMPKWVGMSALLNGMS